MTTSERPKWTDLLAELGWSKARLCRELGLHRNTPLNWGGRAPGPVQRALEAEVRARRSEEKLRRIRRVLATSDD